jgi:nucleoside-diphosphate-sugar epimerase
MRCFVSGGTGFTGAALAKRLIEKGHEVRVLDNQEGLFLDELKQVGAQVTLGSVTDGAVVDKLTEGCDRVYHLAAAFRKVNLGKPVYWDVNVEGTRRMLEAAERHRVPRFVYCSTCGVHGDVEKPPASEDAPIAPADYYQYTKYEGEVVAREFLDRGMWISILRPAAIYGPGDPERFFMIYKRVAKGRFIFLGDGSTTYHPLYIDNLVDAFELASEVDAAKGQAYLIADEEYVPIKTLVLGIAEALGVKLKVIHLPFWPVYAAAVVCETIYKPLPWEPPLFRRRVDWFKQNRAFDITKAKRDLGYAPRVDLPTGLKRTADWYRAMGYLA